MPICASSIPDVLTKLGAAAVLIVAVPAASAGQTAPAPGTEPTSARPAIRSEDALDRLKRARDKGAPSQAAGPLTIPAIPRNPSPRSFERLRRGVSAPEMERHARDATVRAARQVEAERDAMVLRIHQALGLAPIGTLPTDSHARGGNAGPQPQRSGWVPILFVSSSMPVETLRTYAGQLERAQGVLAFRGVPGGLKRMAPMAQLSARILRRDAGCEGPACAMRDVQIIIDPLLFRQQGITRVPALAMVSGDPAKPYCERDDEAPARASHLVLGDAALSGLLEEYARLGGTMEVRDAQARLSSR